MKKVLLGITLLISGAMIMDGCKKPEPVDPPCVGCGVKVEICYPTTLKTSGTSVPDSIEYIRDTKNRVTKENHYTSSGTLGSYMIYTYNAVGYITKVDSFDNTGTVMAYYTFDQTTKEVTKKHFEIETGTLIEKERAVYSLGQSRRPIKAVYYEISGNLPILINSFEFANADTKGNIPSAKVFDDSGKQFGTVTYTYDTKKNFRGNLPEMDFNAINKSSHNLVSAVMKDMTGTPVGAAYTIDYTYTSKDYPLNTHDSRNQGQFLTYDCK